MSATRSAAPSGASHLQWGGRHCDLACPRVLARSMIATKYRLFSAEPKASKFPRYAHTEEVAVLGISIWSPKEWLIPNCWPPCPGEKRRTFNCRASEDDLIEASGPRQEFVPGIPRYRCYKGAENEYPSAARLSVTRVQPFNCALQLFKLPPRLAELAFCC